jgi:N-acyl-D-amino-acid deacylase
MRSVFVLLIPAMLSGADLSSVPIRGAAEKALALIQNSQNNWKQDCSSCHHQFLPALAFHAAQEHGPKFDEAAARAALTKAFAVYSDFDTAVQYTRLIDPAMDDAWRMVAAEAAGVRPSLVMSVYARHVAAYQYPDGHWGTIDMRPPQSYGPFTSTAAAMRAIQLYAHPSLARDTVSRVARARQWLETHTAGNTSERSEQLNALGWAGSPAAIRANLAKQLLLDQQPDGGWASLKGRASDAYATGQALVALATAGGVVISDPAWRRGVQFLLTTQKQDGSWHVPSRLHPPASVSPQYFESGYPYQHDQFVSAMGASYAVMALSLALGPPMDEPVRPLAEIAPSSIEPWAETVLFGTAAELRQLLDEHKLDPNAATSSGGTTALMMSVPDLEKARLLIDRGANAEARAKNRYSALLVASSYPGAAPVLQLLLDHGAQIQVAPGERRPQFNATPLNLAAYARDPEMAKLLLKAGDRAAGKMNPLGLGAVTPLLTAVTFDDAATLATMLDAGTPVDTLDDDGTSLLGWAAIGNANNVARLLIARHANVNLVDKKAMTPLLYAASIDFGDSTMIDLLLKFGADFKARSREGLSALELARKYEHQHLVAALVRGN